jgi:hypothetical protein
VTIPFSAHPVRGVPPEPDTPRWTIRIHRAGAWRGWPWLDGLETRARRWDQRTNRRSQRRRSRYPWAAQLFGTHSHGASDLVLLIQLLLPAPSMAARRMAYLFRRRTDWDVFVYRGAMPDHRPRRAALVQNEPTKAAAAERAEALSAHLLVHDLLPSDLPG